MGHPFFKKLRKTLKNIEKNLDNLSFLLYNGHEPRIEKSLIFLKLYSLRKMQIVRNIHFRWKKVNKFVKPLYPINLEGRFFVLNNSKFRATMALHGDTLETLSEFLEVHPTTLSGKVRGHSEFRLDEIKRLAKHWQLDAQTLFDIFFAEDNE